jgi:diguanylate cyclase (GGDEF)-like protein
MAGTGVQCWLQDLSSDLRLDEVLDRIIENALRACPGREFALFITADDELRLARTSCRDPGSQRRLELPLVAKGRSLGALVAVSPSGEPFEQEERELLDAFTEQAALALANAKLFQTLVENATHDALTALPNRREFERQLSRELDRSRRYGAIFSLAILDLDEFKELNDSRGHQAGDAVLRQAASTIQKTCRASDVPARLGGDEFALLLPATNQFQGAALCERLRTQVEALAQISLSWGVAEYPKHGDTATALTQAADAAMYASKPRLVGGERPPPPASNRAAAQ